MDWLGINETGWVLIFSVAGGVLLLVAIFFVIEVWTAARNVNTYLERKAHDETATVTSRHTPEP